MQYFRTESVSRDDVINSASYTEIIVDAVRWDRNNTFKHTDIAANIS